MASRRKIDQIMAKYNLVSSYIKHHPKRQRTKCNEDELPNIACEAFSTIPYSLNRINIFHTDRGNEFKNKLIDSIIETFNLKRSLSAKGAPLDNTVIESTNHILKTEFIKPYGSFSSLEELKVLLWDYVHWCNNERIHGILGYMTPIQCRKQHNQFSSQNIVYAASLKNCTKKC